MLKIENGFYLKLETIFTPQRKAAENQRPFYSFFVHVVGHSTILCLSKIDLSYKIVFISFAILPTKLTANNIIEMIIRINTEQITALEILLVELFNLNIQIQTIIIAINKHKKLKISIKLNISSINIIILSTIQFVNSISNYITQSIACYSFDNIIYCSTNSFQSSPSSSSS